MKTLLRVLLGIVLAGAVNPLAQGQNFYSLSPLSTFGSHGDGSIRPGDQSFITAGNSQRGMTYNPATGHLVLIDRQTNGNVNPAITGNIDILDGTTGSLITTLNTNGMGGGDLADYAVGVGGDGAIYVGNLINTSTNETFILYYFDSDSSGNPPYLACTNTPGGTNAISERWGDTMDVRGSGTNTQIIIGSKQVNANYPPSTNVTIFTTTDGSNYTATLVATDGNADDFAGGIAFGAGNTFWAINEGHPVRHLSFNLATSNATTIACYYPSNLVANGDQVTIAIDPVNSLLATVDLVTTPNHVKLYDISNPNIAPVWLDDKVYPVTGNNTVAFAHFGGGNLYVEDMNSGLLVFSVAAGTPVVPTITVEPQATIRVALNGTLSVSASGFYATNFQWEFDGSPIANATNTILTVSNMQITNAGSYTVVFNNSSGPTPSSTSAVAVVDPALYPQLTQLWSLKPGDQSFLGGNTSNDGTGRTPTWRSISYGAVSNQVYIPSTSSGNKVEVLNSTNGSVLYGLNMSSVSGGSLVMVDTDTDDDGAVYVGNMSTSAATGAAAFKIYRWGTPNTSTASSVIYSGDPSQAGATMRWGDVIKVNGSGVNAQILVDTYTNNTSLPDTIHTAAAVFTPSSSDLTQTWNVSPFFTQWAWVSGNGVVGAGDSIGRTLMPWPGGSTWYMQKRYGTRLLVSSYNLSTTPPSSTVVATYTNFPTTLGVVSFGIATNLMLAIDYSTSYSSPDTLDLYEVSDLTSPLLLGQYPFPTNHQANSNWVGKIVATTNYAVVLDANNGIMAFSVSTGASTNPPAFNQQPASQRVLVGTNVTFSAFAPGSIAYQWQFDGTNISGATTNTLTLTNVQLTNAGSYRVIAFGFGSTPSSPAILQVTQPTDNYEFKEIWGAVPGGVPYLGVAGSNTNTPLERNIAYSVLSNQLFVINRESGPKVYVLDGTTGSVLYNLNTTGVSGGGLTLVCMAVADDGALYAGNMDTTSTSVQADFKIYRWADSNPNTVPSVIYSGEPSLQPSVFLRWGDAMDVRGSGMNTEILVDANQGTNAADLTFTDSSLTALVSRPFTQSYGGGSIGRSLQFGTNDMMWQKREGQTIELSSFDLVNTNTTLVASYNNFQNPNSLGPVGMDFGRHLLGGIEFASGNNPDTLAFYDITDLTEPLFLGRFNFPTNHQGNGNFIGQVLMTPHAAYAMDANNGLLAIGIEGPYLTQTQSGTNVVLSWSALTGFSLQYTTDLNTSWTNDTTTVVLNGTVNTVTEPATGARYYRLFHN